MKFSDIQTKEDRYEIGVYPKRNIALVRGKGATVWDSEGKAYIDCTSGVGVANIGHCNEQVATALAKQASTLITCYSIFYNDQRAQVLEKLVSIAPKNLTKVFLCNSGTEAVEAALKFARATTGKPEIIALMRGFHGKSMGSLAATWNREYQELFAPMVPGFSHVPSNNIQKLKDAMNGKTAAVIMELVQGEGGVLPLDKAYVQEVRKLCDEQGVLLIIDEVQTGFCRTGTMFCVEQYGILPDLLCCAKSIAGGMPMGATLCCEKITLPKKSHTTTFGGNPLACAAANAAIDFMRSEKLAEKAATNGAYFHEQLCALNHPKIREVRGLGLMIGVELKEKAGMYVQKMGEQGVLALLAGTTTIRFLPPLVISRKEIDSVVSALARVLSE